MPILPYSWRCPMEAALQQSVRSARWMRRSGAAEPMDAALQQSRAMDAALRSLPSLWL
jgi:hypothetical protein